MELALLDTDILSEVLRQRNEIVQRNALQYQREHGALAFSAMTRYEIIRGFHRKNAPVQAARFESFCRHCDIVPLTDAVFDRAAELWARAYRHGQARNDADLLIAATAIESRRDIVTGNTLHLAWIDELSTQDWRQPQ